MRFICLLALLFSAVHWLPSSVALSKGQRENLCSKNRDGCIWINTFFNRSHGFPIHGTVDYHHDLEVYCYEGPEPSSPQGLANIWSGLNIEVKCDNADHVTLHFSNTSVDIIESPNKLHYPNIGNDTFSYEVAPYNVFCVGVEYNGRDIVNYELCAEMVFMWRFPVLLLVGALLLFNARTMSRNIYFHYGTGISIGIMASLLILLLILGRFVPKSNFLALSFLAGGFTLVGTFLFWLARHAVEVATTMWHYLIIYVFVSGVISFAIMYRFGPVENPRTFNLIQWSIQLLALILITLASQLPGVGFMFAVLALLFYFLPTRYNPLVLIFSPLYPVYLLLYRLVISLKNCLLAPFKLCLRWFGPRYEFRYLTMAEYEEQGRIETRKALNALRNYCRENDMWGIIGRLKDANRFTTFLSGRDHITDAEQVDYDYSYTSAATDGDESDCDDDERSASHSVSFSQHHSPSSHESSTHSHTSSFRYTSDESPGPHPSRLHPSPSPPRAPLHGRHHTDTSALRRH